MKDNKKKKDAIQEFDFSSLNKKTEEKSFINTFEESKKEDSEINKDINVEPAFDLNAGALPNAFSPVIDDNIADSQKESKIIGKEENKEEIKNQVEEIVDSNKKEEPVSVVDKNELEPVKLEDNLNIDSVTSENVSTEANEKNKESQETKIDDIDEIKEEAKDLLGNADISNISDKELADAVTKELEFLKDQVGAIQNQEQEPNPETKEEEEVDIEEVLRNSEMQRLKHQIEMLSSGGLKSEDSVSATAYLLIQELYGLKLVALSSKEVQDEIVLQLMNVKQQLMECLEDKKARKLIGDEIEIIINSIFETQSESEMSVFCDAYLNELYEIKVAIFNLNSKEPEDEDEEPEEKEETSKEETKEEEAKKEEPKKEEKEEKEETKEQPKEEKVEKNEKKAVDEKAKEEKKVEESKKTSDNSSKIELNEDEKKVVSQEEAQKIFNDALESTDFDKANSMIFDEVKNLKEALMKLSQYDEEPVAPQKQEPDSYLLNEIKNLKNELSKSRTGADSSNQSDVNAMLISEIKKLKEELTERKYERDSYYDRQPPQYFVMPPVNPYFGMGGGYPQQPPFYPPYGNYPSYGQPNVPTTQQDVEQKKKEDLRLKEEELRRAEEQHLSEELEIEKKQKELEARRNAEKERLQEEIRIREEAIKKAEEVRNEVDKQSQKDETDNIVSDKDNVEVAEKEADAISDKNTVVFGEEEAVAESELKEKEKTNMVFNAETDENEDQSLEENEIEEVAKNGENSKQDVNNMFSNAFGMQNSDEDESDNELIEENAVYNNMVFDDEDDFERDEDETDIFEPVQEENEQYAETHEELSSFEGLEKEETQTEEKALDEMLTNEAAIEEESEFVGTVDQPIKEVVDIKDDNENNVDKKEDYKEKKKEYDTLYLNALLAVEVASIREEIQGLKSSIRELPQQRVDNISGELEELAKRVESSASVDMADDLAVIREEVMLLRDKAEGLRGEIQQQTEEKLVSLKEQIGELEYKLLEANRNTFDEYIDYVEKMKKEIMSSPKFNDSNAEYMSLINEYERMKHEITGKRELSNEDFTAINNLTTEINDFRTELMGGVKGENSIFDGLVNRINEKIDENKKIFQSFDERLRVLSASTENFNFKDLNNSIERRADENKNALLDKLEDLKSAYNATNSKIETEINLLRNSYKDALREVQEENKKEVIEKIDALNTSVNDSIVDVSGELLEEMQTLLAEVETCNNNNCCVMPSLLKALIKDTRKTDALIKEDKFNQKVSNKILKSLLAEIYNNLSNSKIAGSDSIVLMLKANRKIKGKLIMKNVLDPLSEMLENAENFETFETDIDSVARFVKIKHGFVNNEEVISIENELLDSLPSLLNGTKDGEMEIATGALRAMEEAVKVLSEIPLSYVLDLEGVYNQLNFNKDIYTINELRDEILSYLDAEKKKDVGVILSNRLEEVNSNISDTVEKSKKEIIDDLNALKDDIVSASSEKDEKITEMKDDLIERVNELSIELNSSLNSQLYELSEQIKGYAADDTENKDILNSIAERINAVIESTKSNDEEILMKVNNLSDNIGKTVERTVSEKFDNVESLTEKTIKENFSDFTSNVDNLKDRIESIKGATAESVKVEFDLFKETLSKRDEEVAQKVSDVISEKLNDTEIKDELGNIVEAVKDNAIKVENKIVALASAAQIDALAENLNHLAETIRTQPEKESESESLNQLKYDLLDSNGAINVELQNLSKQVDSVKSSVLSSDDTKKIVDAYENLQNEFADIKNLLKEKEEFKQQLIDEIKTFNLDGKDDEKFRQLVEEMKALREQIVGNKENDDSFEIKELVGEMKALREQIANNDESLLSELSLVTNDLKTLKDDKQPILTQDDSNKVLLQVQRLSNQLNLLMNEDDRGKSKIIKEINSLKEGLAGLSGAVASNDDQGINASTTQLSESLADLRRELDEIASILNENDEKADSVLMDTETKEIKITAEEKTEEVQTEPEKPKVQKKPRTKKTESATSETEEKAKEKIEESKIEEVKVEEPEKPKPIRKKKTTSATSSPSTSKSTPKQASDEEKKEEEVKTATPKKPATKRVKKEVPEKVTAVDEVAYTSDIVPTARKPRAPKKTVATIPAFTPELRNDMSPEDLTLAEQLATKIADRMIVERLVRRLTPENASEEEIQDIVGNVIEQNKIVDSKEKVKELTTEIVVDRLKKNKSDKDKD